MQSIKRMQLGKISPEFSAKGRPAWRQPFLSEARIGRNFSRPVLVVDSYSGALNFKKIHFDSVPQ